MDYLNHDYDQQRVTSRVKKNPYLSKFKNDIAARQSIIRERLSASNKTLNSGGVADEIRNSTTNSGGGGDGDDDERFPAIDGGDDDERQHLNSTSNSRAQFNNQYKDKLNYLSDYNKNSAFVANTRTTNTATRFKPREQQQPPPTTATSANKTQVANGNKTASRLSLQTSYFKDYQASNLSSSTLAPTNSELKTAPRGNLESSAAYNNDRIRQIAREYDREREQSQRAQKEQANNNSQQQTYKTSNLDDLLPEPPKFNKASKQRDDYSKDIQNKLESVSLTRAPKETIPLSATRYISNNNASNYDSQRQRASPIDSDIASTQRPLSKRVVVEKVFADEVDKKKAIARQESPTKSDTSASFFSRKVFNGSLTRFNDSIRLKALKKTPPPVAPQADVIEANADDETNSHISERAVDVLRESKRDKKKKSKLPHQQQLQTSAEQQVVPVRNFAEIRNVIVELNGQSSLGVTVRIEDGNIVVARVLIGGLADSQNSLQAGDIILSVNNREIYTPEQLQEQLRNASLGPKIFFKIVPSYKEEKPVSCIYLRALFSYDPNEDSLLPCKEVGVAFNQGDILEVVNQEDTNWWQARRVDSENLQSGLIPSQQLEERRRAFVLPDYDLATKTSLCGTRVSRVSRKKEIYNIGFNSDFDKAELSLYEEVCRTPAFERRTLVLISANGVGRQALKSRLIANNPDKFASPLPFTSRALRPGEENGVHYNFESREQMEEDIIAGKYLEYGEYEGALYGTKLDTVRQIIGSGKMCVLDCSPTCLKLLKTPDYLPFVVFIAAPPIDQFRYLHDSYAQNRTYATLERSASRQSRRGRTLQDFAYEFFEDEDLQIAIEESAILFRTYENYFNLVLVNENFDQTYEHIRDAVDALSMAPQWIPISWIYGT